MLIPEYLKEFKCIGSECEDTCCKSWRVDIDKRTYNKYKKSKNIKLKPLFQRYIKRNHNNKTESCYGKLKMNNDGYCPFLDENKMCSLYKEIGEENLSQVCKIYPRYTVAIDNNLEQCLTPSCPEVARLVLFNENGICFQEINEDDKNISMPKYLKEVVNTKNKKVNKYFWHIRIFSLNLLQNRNYSLDERMIILGIVYEKLQILLDNKKYEYIVGLLDEMEELINSMDLKNQLRNIPSNYDIQMRIAKELSDERLIGDIKFTAYLKCVEQTLKGIKFIEGNTMDKVLEEYKSAYNNYAKPYFDLKPYVLENFVVNQFFIELIPYVKYRNIWDSYIFISVMYSMLKFHLIGISSYNKKLDNELVVKTVYSFSRSILHTTNYIKHVINLIKENKFDTLAHMCILIKS